MFRVIRARLQHRRFDGSFSEPITRINFERGDSAGVLLHDPQDDTVILVNQFRYPVYASLGAGQRAGEGARQAWLLEIAAGMVDEGQTVAEVAQREVIEEAGFAIKGPLQPITTVYPSPGGSSERITLYLAEVDRRSPAASGGGLIEKGEDIQVVAVPYQEAMAMVASGEINDAKTIIALQYLALLTAGSADRMSSP
ncbi:MAG: NUDIX domain-containing protein [Chloroflexota bacterium]|nr:MAG: NUDIX domain-containing protein [Chloroflexota bacterium]